MSHHDCGTDGSCGRHRMDTLKGIIPFTIVAGLLYGEETTGQHNFYEGIGP